jgi:hypothetical protein
MRRILVLLFVMALTPFCCAQNWTTVTASKITDGRSASRLLTNGKICFTATGDNGQAINFRVGGGGQNLNTPYCAWVKNGAIQGELQVPNPQHTSPANIKYRIEVSDGASVIRRDSGVLLTSDTFDYDAYVPTTATLQTGQSVDDLGVGVLRFPDGTSQTTSPDTALAAKVPTSREVNRHALTEDVTLTKSDVGLGSVDNTADADKPISTDTQTALNAKADSATVTAQLSTRADANTVNAHTSATQAHGANGAIVGAIDLSVGLATKAPSVHGHSVADVNSLQATLDGKAPVSRQVAGHALSEDVTLTKADVGLSAVDNTADADKPVSSAVQSALNAKAASNDQRIVNAVQMDAHGSAMVGTTCPEGAAANSVCIAGEYYMNGQAFSGSPNIRAYPTCDGSIAPPCKVVLTGQTTAITATTIFTPPVSGLYRFAAYLVITSTNATGGTVGPVSFNYSDGTTGRNSSVGNSVGASSTGAASGTGVYFVNSSSPLRYFVAYGASGGSATYSVYFIIE